MVVASWAADCAEHVLGIFEQAAPGDARPRELIARARAFADGELGAADAIRQRTRGGVPAAHPWPPAAHAAAQAAGQAAAVAHMGAHALGAAGYAAQAAGLDGAESLDAAEAESLDAAEAESRARQEIEWQLARLSEAARSALCRLPQVGTDTSGPLGPGLLTSGRLGVIITDLQLRLTGVGPG